MNKPQIDTQQQPTMLAKCPTGIQGLDEITYGGLPQGRPVLLCGKAGCGKTLMAMEFLVRGATLFDEPGVFMAFEETAEEFLKQHPAVKQKLEERRASDTAFAKSSSAQLNFVYQHSPYYEPMHLRYPVYRIK